MGGVIYRTGTRRGRGGRLKRKRKRIWIEKDEEDEPENFGNHSDKYPCIQHSRCVTIFFSMGSRNSLLVERWTRDRKVASSNPWRSGGRIFFFRVDFVC